jgi:DNA-binding transcriptional MerR regulator
MIAMYTIGQLSREFHLSRSTLLYYDSIGLLCATGRTEGNYRQYSGEDRDRLIRICTYREAGVPLLQIKDLLVSNETMEHTVLEKHLASLNRDMQSLRLKQRLIIAMLRNKDLAVCNPPLDKQTFVAVLSSAGLDEQVQQRLHMEFEKSSPESHQTFLEYLGLSDDEIANIRTHSKKNLRDEE